MQSVISAPVALPTQSLMMWRGITMLTLLAVVQVSIGTMALATSTTPVSTLMPSPATTSPPRHIFKGVQRPQQYLETCGYIDGLNGSPRPLLAVTVVDTIIGTVAKTYS
jgi:hypothetical protein